MSDRPAAPRPALRSLTPVGTATALLMASQAVAGFAVGHSFRVPVSRGLALRFVQDPFCALIMCAIAAGSTYLIARAGFAAKSPRIGALVCLGGGVIAGGVNGFLSLTVLSSARAGLDLGAVIATSQNSLVRGFAMVPPGLFWSLGAAALVMTSGRANDDREEGVLRAIWAGGLCLLASSEAAIVIFASTLSRIVASLGLLAGIALAGYGVWSQRRRLAATAAVLVVIQVWVAALHAYWRS